MAYVTPGVMVPTAVSSDRGPPDANPPDGVNLSEPRARGCGCTTSVGNTLLPFWLTQGDMLVSNRTLVSSGPCGPSTVITSPPTRMSYGLWARSEVHSYILVVNRSICRWVVSAVSPDTHP